MGWPMDSENLQCAASKVAPPRSLDYPSSEIPSPLTVDIGASVRATVTPQPLQTTQCNLHSEIGHILNLMSQQQNEALCLLTATLGPSALRWLKKDMLVYLAVLKLNPLPENTWTVDERVGYYCGQVKEALI